MKKFSSIKDLIKLSQEMGEPIGEVVIKYEMGLIREPRDFVVQEMKARIEAIEKSIEKGKERRGKTLGGLAITPTGKRIMREIFPPE